MDANTRDLIEYYKNYKKSLNDFIYSESDKLTIRNYMRLVDEVVRITEFIETLETGI